MFLFVVNEYIMVIVYDCLLFSFVTSVIVFFSFDPSS